MQDISEQLDATYPVRREYHLPRFSASEIADSGQCFRWMPVSDGKGDDIVSGFHSLIADGRRAVMFQRESDDEGESASGAAKEDELVLWCEREKDELYWEDYLTLHDDYDGLYARLVGADPFTRTAAFHYPKMRILRQEPFEITATSIVTQNNNIARIRKIVASICGESDVLVRGSVTPSESASRPVFPDTVRLAEVLDGSDLGLGYRRRYLVRLCADWASGEYDGLFDANASANVSTSDAIKQLSQHLGIGNKVAACIALFGMHRLDAVPRDVWIKRAEEEHGVRWVDDIAGFQQQLVFEEVRRLSE